MHNYVHYVNIGGNTICPVRGVSLFRGFPMSVSTGYNYHLRKTIYKIIHWSIYAIIIIVILENS